MRTLLIVDDADTRQWLEQTLARRRHETAAVAELDAALAAFDAGPFPVVVLALDAPGTGVADFCRRLRAVAPQGDCTLLAVGREEHPADLPELFTAGVDDYLVVRRDTPRLEERLAAAERRQAAPVAEARERTTPAADALLQAHGELQAIYDRMSDGMIIADAETQRFVRVNPAICRMLGYSEAELLRMGTDSIHPAADMPKVLAAFEAMRRGEAMEVGNLCCLRKDGSTIDVDIAGNHLNYRGRPYIVGFFRDVTERKRAAESLRIQRDLGVALSSCSDLGDALDLILQAACRIPGIDCGGIYLVDEHRDLHLAAHAGVSPEFVAAVRHFPHDSPEARLAEEGCALYEDQPRVTQGTYDSRIAEGLRSVAIIPVKHEGQLIALLNVASYARDGIPVSTRHALETLASRLGGVLARLKARMELLESEEKFQNFVRHSPYGYVETDMAGNIEFVNRRIADILGYAPQDGIGVHFARFMDPTDLPRALANLEALARGVVAEPHEYLYRAKDGSARIIEMTSLQRRKEGRLVGFQSVMLDVTQRKAAEQALREHDAMLRGLFENLPDVVLVVDRDATLRYINRAAPGADPQQLPGSAGFSFLAPESQAAAQRSFAQALATRQVQAVEALDVYGVWWACRLVPLVEDDEVQNVIVICTDVTQQKGAADALAKEQRLLRQLLDLHERDRQVMAYEIHDGFAQQLTAALYSFQAFQGLRGQMPDKAASSFESGMKLLSGSIDETRRLIGGLRPPILDEFGIVAAIEYLTHDCHSRGGPEVEFDYDVSFDRLAPPLETAIFRIVQESLTNVCRHSQSAKARIGFSQADGRVLIDVRDWGVGFDPACVQEGRFGLQGIRERARLLGGRVVITTAPNEGTHVFVELPLIERAPEPEDGEE